MLEIRDAGEGEVVATVATASSKVNPQAARRGISPQAAAALVAVTLIAGLAVFVLWAPEPATEPMVAQPVIKLAPAQPVVDQAPVEKPATPNASEDPVESRLKALGGWLLAYHDKNGAFPSAAVAGERPVNERLGWLALYREATERRSLSTLNIHWAGVTPPMKRSSGGGPTRC